MAWVYMYDAVTVANIPVGAAIVAGYVDGHYANFNEMVTRFPAALHVSITVFGGAGARVADCETGDLTPAQAALWAHNERMAGRRPTVYCNLSTQPSVAQALTAYGLQFGRDVDWWAAGYTGHPYLAVGSVATQWSGGVTAPYDISVTDGVWPAPAPVPVPPPPIGPTNMLTNCKGMAPTSTLKGYWEVQADGGVFSHGDAAFHGSLGGKVLAAPIVDIARSQGGAGYYLAGADGGVFCFGDAKFYGSLGGRKLDQPIVGIVPTPEGYWMVAEDGGIFAFGDAAFYGAGAK